MPQENTASGRWEALSGQRRGFINRCELYSSYTLPKICPQDSYDQNVHELTHDFQSVGAQATNHLANKIMLALFAPSRPFFRADPDEQMQREIEEMGVDPSQVAMQLAKAEKDAVKHLDQLAMRPKMYEVLKHLIITGNVLLWLDPDKTRVLGIKKYVVRRNAVGEVIEILIGDRVLVDELDADVQAVIRDKDPSKEVNHFRWFKRDSQTKDFHMTQWVNDQQLGKEFDGKWPEARMPFRVLTWDLSDGADYGTGLVEDYRGDFAALSALSKAQVIGAVLSSEFRWLVNPGGMTKPEDLERSENGSALPGLENDISLIQSGKSSDLQTTLNVNAEYVNRVSRGFLLGASLVRNAERVTAEEIRLLANELETALGGAYSRLAVDIQLPMALWLMDLIGLTTEGSGFNPTVVTGLEALSRSGDLEELKALFMDLSLMGQLPESLQARIKWQSVMSAFAAARRIDASDFLKGDAEVAQEQQAAQQAQMEQQIAQGAAEGAIEQATAPEQGQ